MRHRQGRHRQFSRMNQAMQQLVTERARMDQLAPDERVHAVGTVATHAVEAFDAAHAFHLPKVPRSMMHAAVLTAQQTVERLDFTATPGEA